MGASDDRVCRGAQWPSRRWRAQGVKVIDQDVQRETLDTKMYVNLAEIAPCNALASGVLPLVTNGHLANLGLYHRELDSRYLDGLRVHVPTEGGGRPAGRRRRLSRPRTKTTKCEWSATRARTDPTFKRASPRSGPPAPSSWTTPTRSVPYFPVGHHTTSTARLLHGSAPPRSRQMPREEERVHHRLPCREGPQCSQREGPRTHARRRRRRRTAEVQTGGTVGWSGVSACGVALYTTHVETKGVCARAERGMPVGAARKPKRLT